MKTHGLCVLCAGINFNEDSIGGSLIEGNLIFNMCRESGDHGPCTLVDRLRH